MSTRPHPSRYQKGMIKGELLVVCDPIRKTNGHEKRKWWVMVQCKKCGGLEWMHQNQLDNRVDCSQCYEDRRGLATRLAKAKEQEALPFVPFERLRW